MRPRAASASACSKPPFSTARESCFSILPIPPSSLSWPTSRTTTSHPAWAQIWVIPWPISPQPRTPTLLISMGECPSFAGWICTEDGAAAYTPPGLVVLGEDRLQLREAGAQGPELADRAIYLVRQPVDGGERRGVRVDPEEGPLSHRGHSDGQRVTIRNRDDRKGLDERAAAHVQRF